MSKVGLDDVTAAGGTVEEIAGFPRVEAWPRVDSAAFYGLAGRIVEAIDPYSEADPAATLAHVLVAVGNVSGPRPHCLVLHDRHPARLYVAIVGESGTVVRAWRGARRGISWNKSCPTGRLVASIRDSVAAKG